jgi:nitrite reductase/ring-hydroxylating ferredoxin subunit
VSPAPPDFWKDRDNPALPPPGAVLGALADVPNPGARAFWYEAGEARASVIIARRGDDLRAYLNICPHARMPLERPDGQVVLQEGRFLLCSAHAASFRLEDGACVGGPGLGRALQALAVRVDGAVVVRDK